MKYVVLLCDGMADLPVSELSGKTPMEAAKKPNIDSLAGYSEVGLCKTIPDGFPPGSDVANLSVMGYAPAECYTGRSPLEAASIGVEMRDTDLALRCNLVTLSGEPDFGQKTMLDYCAGDISTAEAAELIGALDGALGGGDFKFYPGVSYRHCLIWAGGPDDPGALVPPHDITGRPVKAHLPQGPDARALLELMKKSAAVLGRHPVNLQRIKQGKRPANAIWLWGSGRRPALQPFSRRYGMNGSVISAVDLLRGIGILAGMRVPLVAGATGYLDTNFAGKAAAALDELKNGSDYAYIHIEAPDECGHRFEAANKVLSVELIDKHVLPALLRGLAEYGDYRLMILPDHPTPLALGTHTADPVPFMIFQKKRRVPGVPRFTEAAAAKTGVVVESGPALMERFLGKAVGAKGRRV